MLNTPALYRTMSGWNSLKASCKALLVCPRYSASPTPAVGIADQDVNSSHGQQCPSRSAGKLTDWDMRKNCRCNEMVRTKSRGVYGAVHCASSGASRAVYRNRKCKNMQNMELENI